MKPKLPAAVAISAMLAAPAAADDILKGTRGPTQWQIDLRVGYARQGNGTQAATGNAILKYWDGDERGKWCFVNAPYRVVSAPSGESAGIGDVTLGCGPRGTAGNFHFLAFGAATLPTGDYEDKPALGNGRRDARAGAFATYLSADKRFEIDGSAEYAWTGENRAGTDPADELALGVVAGGQTSERTRLAAGFTGTFRENDDYALRARAVWRGIRSKREHLELIVDIDLKSRNIPRGKGATLVYRRSF